MKLISFYLPQFHPIPENDAWWGKGFTEWTNVAGSTPRFNGHYQPHLPADLGFYDLRLPETRQAQADLAKSSGIHGFCYYHYWFNGKMLLERPFNEVLASGEPDFPFCLCWANENWTRRWDGLDREVLMAQDYQTYDPEQHITWLERAFADDRYIKIQGKPLFLIYRADQIPQMREVIQSWRRTLQLKGYPGLYLCAVKNMQYSYSDRETVALGFDALVDFQPNPADVAASHAPTGKPSVSAKVKNIIGTFIQKFMPGLIDHACCSYGKIAEYVMHKPQSETKTFPCVFPSWDNSPRKKTGATVIQNEDAALYGKWLTNALERVRNNPADERIVFINAWNEWAEGCHLEPDLRNGKRFLDVTRQALEGFREKKDE